MKTDLPLTSLIPPESGSPDEGASREDLLCTIRRLQNENKQLNRSINLLRKKIDTAEIAAETDKLIGDLRSVEQKKLEKYMKLLLEYSQIAILMFDENGCLAYCTNEFLRLINIDNFGIINGRSFEYVAGTFCGEELVKSAAGIFKKVRDSMEPCTVNTKLLFPANTAERFYTIQLAPITENGVFDGEIMICHDTTELRNAEAEERTRLMLDSTPLACMLWTAKGRLLGWNKKTVELLDLNSDEVSTDNFFNRCAETQDDGVPSIVKWRSLIKAALENGSVRTEWNCILGSGEMAPLEATFVRMPWKNYFRVAVYADDLRELRKHEMAARKANEENRMLELEAKAAEAASKAKSDFLAVMSHELRTPMNVIIGMSELIPVENLNEQQKNFFWEIQNMSKTLLKLINDILDFSKIEAGKLEVLPVNYNIRTLVDTVSSMLKFAAEKKGISFNARIAGDIPEVLYGDEIRVRQLFTNIISNSIKYTREGSIDIDVTKTIENDKPYLEIRVKDTGIGIKKEEVSRLFSAFQQLDARKNRGIVGTGLGLAICKRLVDMMEGSISVESEYGKGSVFTVRLPLTEGNPTLLNVEKLRKASKNCDFVTVKKDERVKALVVDDMPENLTVASGFLALHNIEADAVLSGMEALEKAKKTKYDIVFMDQMMPEMDGIDAARCIRALEEKTGDPWFGKMPIIALSANAVIGAREEFIAAGMNDSISKPIEAKTLNAKLALWLPPEKIEYSVKKPDKGGKDSGYPVFEQLRGVKEIDLEDGITHTGSAAAYIKVIKQYCSGFAASTLALPEILEKKDINAYNIKVHALKGVFATLGVKSLSEWAKKLEFASADAKTANSGFSETCVNETKPFVEECKAFFDALPAAVKPDGAARRRQSDFKTDAGNAAFLLNKLEELKTALETGYANSVNEICGELCKLSFDDKTDGFIGELSRLAADFDYDIAKQKIEGFLYAGEK
ncbi:MAG: response regulator [Spirochaetaceae bacterium]|jgi:signal transduction histidine kinase/HPt (histidine-containing phosphotransfer) domain-containing protein/ActR/RegA family two-component response regulator|nr:response regulator [Spirochaetaceae bacterium]